MAHMRKFSLTAFTLLLSVCSIGSARAAEPPADLCTLLPATEVSRILGQPYNAPAKSVAPRPYANTATGTDCNYSSKNGKLWFRGYVDPSPSAATDLFARLKMFYSPPTPVAGIGDEAYFDRDHAIHVRKGKVRYYLNLSPINTFTPAVEKQIKDLASRVAAQL
jgi:hypothetical protein